MPFSVFYKAMTISSAFQHILCPGLIFVVHVGVVVYFHIRFNSMLVSVII